MKCLDCGGHKKSEHGLYCKGWITRRERGTLCKIYL